MPSIANSHEEISVTKEAMGMHAAFYFGYKNCQISPKENGLATCKLRF
jgi:hypothetical protein